MGIFAAVPIRPPPVGVIDHHQADRESAVDIGDSQGGCGYDIPGDRFGVNSQEGVEQGWDMVLAHGVHGDQGQRQIADVGIDHGPQIGLEALPAAGHGIQLALDLQQRHEVELHLPTLPHPEPFPLRHPEDLGHRPQK